MEERIINLHNFEAGHGPKAGSPPRSCSFSEVLPLFIGKDKDSAFPKYPDPCIGTCRLTTLRHLRGWPGPHNVPVEAAVIPKALASAAAALGCYKNKQKRQRSSPPPRRRRWYKLLKSQRIYPRCCSSANPLKEQTQIATPIHT